jgi:hypothetical protein
MKMQLPGAVFTGVLLFRESYDNDDKHRLYK